DTESHRAPSRQAFLDLDLIDQPIRRGAGGELIPSPDKTHSHQFASIKETEAGDAGDIAGIGITSRVSIKSRLPIERSDPLNEAVVAIDEKGRVIHRDERAVVHADLNLPAIPTNRTVEFKAVAMIKSQLKLTLPGDRQRRTGQRLV